MRLTTKTRYAVRAICELAEQPADAPTSLKIIANKQGIKLKYLEQIFINLHKAGLVKSRKGPHGGYVLGRKPAKIKLLEIMQAVGETTNPVFCADDNNRKFCPRMNTCSARPFWRQMKTMIEKFLSSHSIQDLCGCQGLEGQK
jgi:Rrf2 family protein